MALPTTSYSSRSVPTTGFTNRTLPSAGAIYLKTSDGKKVKTVDGKWVMFQGEGSMTDRTLPTTSFSER